MMLLAGVIRRGACPFYRCCSYLPLNHSNRNYHPNVIYHYENPRNVGRFEEDEVQPDEIVATGLVGSPACGDVLKIQMKIDENGFIRDARFKTFGCGSAIASSSYTTEIVKDKKVEEAYSIKNDVIAKHLSLPPVKRHCSMLSEDAIKDAIRNYWKQVQSTKK
jgi:Fe-S cluster assembly scaffold IscU